MFGSILPTFHVCGPSWHASGLPMNATFGESMARPNTTGMPRWTKSRHLQYNYPLVTCSSSRVMQMWGHASCRLAVCCSTIA